MRNLLTEAFARLILATRLIDRSYRAIDRIRSALVLALASDAVLSRFNSLAYSRDGTYYPQSSEFRSYLFPWEEKVVAEYFPRVPARLIIGGAGGGREVLALARMGYDVVAFEPSAVLADMARRATKGSNVRVYRGGYEDLPRMFPWREQEPDGTGNVDSTFDAAILGWGSYSHLRTEDQRIQTLSWFARHVQGPILLSFYQFAKSRKISTDRRRRLKIWPSLRVGNRFSVYIGYTHDVSAAELRAVADRSGLTIVHLNEDSRDTNWPHAILYPQNITPTLDNDKRIILSSP